MFQTGTRGLKRDPIIRLETSSLKTDKGEMINLHTVNRGNEYNKIKDYEIQTHNARRCS